MDMARLSLAVALLTVCRAVARLAAWVAPVVAASLVPIEAGAQDRAVDQRWRIVVERDTMAIGPLDDVRLWAGLRAAKNEEVRRCVWELHQRANEVALLRSALDLSRKSDKANAELVGDLNEAVIQQANRLSKSRRRGKLKSLLSGVLSGAATGAGMGYASGKQGGAVIGGAIGALGGAALGALIDTIIR